MSVVKFKLMSDVHLEFNNNPSSFIQAQNFDNLNAVVIAGDFDTNDSTLYLSLKEISGKAKVPVLFVPGNHEYYHSSLEAVISTLVRLEDEVDNFYWLRRTKPISIEGVLFIGATMWYRDFPARAGLQFHMNDYHVINDHVHWVFEENRKDVKWLRYALSTFSGPKVVVTHHAPTFKSVEGRYIGSVLNDFYVCNMEQEIIEHKPEIWCHGHMHYHKDYKILDTRIIANPRGYTGEYGEEIELSGFEPDKIFEVSNGQDKAS